MSTLGGHRPIRTGTALHFTNLQQQKVSGTFAASIKKKFLSEEKRNIKSLWLIVVHMLRPPTGVGLWIYLPCLSSLFQTEKQAKLTMGCYVSLVKLMSSYNLSQSGTKSLIPVCYPQIHVNVPLIQLLLSQKYRHVDNIMFENHTIADRFLDFWRKTGNQRMGYLYGRYTEHKDIPLGIRAEVAAIYEPPQVNFCSHIESL